MILCHCRIIINQIFCATFLFQLSIRICIVVVSNSSVRRVKLSGSVSPQLSGVVVTIERRIGSGKWKKLGTARTGSTGKWKLVTRSYSKKATVSYRVKTSDARLGKVTSSTKKLSVK